MSERPRVVVVGGGFAGFHAARNLAKRLGDEAEIVLVNTTDYFLYLPLLPEVAAGVLEPRRIAVPLAASLPGVRVVLGEVDEIDLAAQRVGWSDPEGERDGIAYDRLLLAVGSVNKLLPIPGVAEHAHGFRGLPEALYLRDHIVRQFELAADDRRPRRAGGALHVRGGRRRLHRDRGRRAGRAAHRQPARRAPGAARPARALDAARHRGAGAARSWTSACRATADRVLRERGVEVRMGVSVDEADHDGVRLTDGDDVPTRTLIWCVGVRPDPLVESLGLKTEKGRVVVDEFMRVPGHPEVFACGDAAAVPDADPARAGDGDDRPARAAAGQARGAQRRRVARARHRPAGTSTTTWASSSSSAAGTPRPTRCTCRSRACRPRRSPAATTSRRCRGTGSGRRPTGRSTRCCRARPCSSGWCAATRCRWRPRRRSTRTTPEPARPAHRGVTRCHAQVTRPRFPPGTLRFMVIDGDLAARARADDVSFLLALFVDLAGKPCAKLVPVEAAEAFQTDGVGFAGFAVGAIGQAPSDPDLIAMPDARVVHAAALGPRRPRPRPLRPARRRRTLALRPARDPQGGTGAGRPGSQRRRRGGVLPGQP